MDTNERESNSLAVASKAYDIHTRNLPHPTPATSPAPYSASSFNWDTKSTHSAHSDHSTTSTYAPPSSMPSIETIRRSAEREAWAQLGHIRSQQRLRALKEGQGRKQLQNDTGNQTALEIKCDEEKEEKKLQVDKAQEVKRETKKKGEEEYKVLVETMVQEIYKLSPEWEARKSRLEQVRRKAYIICTSRVACMLTGECVLQMKASRPSVSRNASSKTIWTLTS